MATQLPTELTLILQPKLAEKIYQAILSLSDNSTDATQAETVETIDVLPLKMKGYGIDSEKEVSEKILNIQKSIQALALKDLHKSLKELEKIYEWESENHTLVLILLSRYNRIQNYLNKEIIELEYVDQKITKIFNTVIEMVKNLEEEDLR